MKDQNKLETIGLENLIYVIEEAMALKRQVVVDPVIVLSALRYGQTKANEVAAMQHALDSAYASNAEHLTTIESQTAMIESQRNQIIQLAAANHKNLVSPAAASVAPAPQPEAPAAQESTLLRSPRVVNHVAKVNASFIGQEIKEINERGGEVLNVVIREGLDTHFYVFYKTYKDQ